jgi:flagellar hook assembly protein FlgD
MLFQIRYQLKQDADIRLSIFDITGREVRALFSGRQRAGDHSAIWNGADDSGKIVASGIYFVKLQDGKRHSLVRKMTMVK